MWDAFAEGGCHNAWADTQGFRGDQRVEALAKAKLDRLMPRKEDEISADAAPPRCSEKNPCCRCPRFRVLRLSGSFALLTIRQCAYDTSRHIRRIHGSPVADWASFNSPAQPASSSRGMLAVRPRTSISSSMPGSHHAVFEVMSLLRSARCAAI